MLSQAHVDGLLVFKKFDVDSDGYLEADEADQALRYLGISHSSYMCTKLISVIQPRGIERH